MASLRHQENYERLLRAQLPPSISSSAPVSESETPEPTRTRDGYVSEMLNSQAQAIAYITKNLSFPTSPNTSPSQSPERSQVTATHRKPVLSPAYHPTLHCDTPLPTVEYDGYDSDESPRGKRITIKIKLTTLRQNKSKKSTPKKERPVRVMKKGKGVPQKAERYRAIRGIPGSGKIVFRRID